MPIWSLFSCLLVSLCCLLSEKTEALSQSSPDVTRREALIGASTFALSTLPVWSPTDPSNAAVIDQLQSKPKVAVIGANGRTGALCVTACLKRGISVRALTRTGTWQPPLIGSGDNYNDSNESLLSLDDRNLSILPCDIKDPEVLANSLKGCTAVIYAASASKKGGDARAIDNLGVVSAAQACLNENIERYVILSSTATTRPASLGYIFTNVLGGIMNEKRQGEVSVQRLYEAKTETPCSYTIVRPGGLEENKVLGPSALEVSQGDVFAGIVSRADLAEATVELAIRSSPNLRNTALELYYASSAQPCERRFSPLLKNGQAPRLHGESYEELFRGVEPNVDYLML